jgi:predicted outer membrane protein
MIEKAILAINPNASFSSGNDMNRIRWHDGNPNNITVNQIQAKIAELEAAEPLRQLREQRNQLLAQSDWMAVSDRTMTQAQIDYRQALRDLPETADPQLDEQGNLTNVTWPSL